MHCRSPKKGTPGEGGLGDSLSKGELEGQRGGGRKSRQGRETTPQEDGLHRRRVAGQALREHLTQGFADGVKQGSEDLF